MASPLVHPRTTIAPASAANPAPDAPSTVDAESPALANPWRPEAPARAWRYVILHHSGTSEGSVESIDAIHRERTDDDGNHWLGIGYHFVIGNGHGMPDGRIEPTFRWRKQLHGAHAGTRTHNDWGIGICLIGDFEQTPPTERQLRSLARLLSVLESAFDLSRSDVLRHSDVKATQCPGEKFPFEQIVDGLKR